MTRRLVASFAFVAILSVLLTAAGVATLTNIEQSANAATELEAQLTDVANLLTETTTTNRRTFRATNNLIQSFDLVVIGPAGKVLELSQTDNPLEFADIDQVQLAELSQSGFILVDTSAVTENGEEVQADLVGLKRVDLQLANNSELLEDSVLAVYGAKSTSPFSRNIVLWFIGSFVLATLVALGVGSFLARKLSSPIKRIEQATKRLAIGDLAVRVEEAGPEEVASLAGSVNSLAKELTVSKNLDRQFLLSVSHDLRTPLTVIKGYAEALTDSAIDDTVAAGKVLKSHSERLEHLVTDLLDLARLDANRFEFNLTSFDLSVAIRELSQGVSVSGADSKVQFSSEIEPNIFVYADKQRCLQVVGNLVDNAVKYTANKVQVGLTANSEFAEIVVTDDGPGISGADLDKVFDRFYMSSQNPESNDKSYGLGLAIAKELAVGMGGQIFAQSEQSLGTTMRFRLPLSKL